MASPEITPSAPCPPPTPDKTDYDQSADSLPVSRAYSTSSQQFLTKQLPQSFLTIRPYLSSSSASYSWKVKIWKLYITILDTAAKASQEEGKKVWGRGEWSRVMRLAKYNAVWDECEQAFGQNDMDLDVVTALIMVSLRHADNLRDLRKRIEKYLDFDTKQENLRIRSLIELYIMHVLPKSNDWEYAREFINTRFSSQGQYKTDILKRLNEIENNTIAETAEKIRLEEEAHKLEQKQNKKFLLPHDSTRRISFSETQSVTDDHSKAELTSLSKESTTTGSKSFTRPLTPSKNPMGLVSHLRHSISLSNSGFIRIIIFLMALFGVLGRKYMRRKAMDFLRVVYGKAISTLGMGIRATYM
ncbi:hypothetical protein NEOLI_000851 [Neolecta irregularis DAH-3]|uniref:Uncharacterized protein n=1 Tax=Neolecta irregularis (strain DAH-3) TaxID=1198029 RepID=A0A1U7LL66_NEOID|nr:hypothetical protein NEOLI_000851 [Neolecta irregularis DAH-3]|eukprot:OLL23261.1 hypothetical protein NEOLI_000851 [Neolecta irregularis DAH-3]